MDKKNKRKSKQQSKAVRRDKPNGKQQAAAPPPEQKQYSLTREELAAYSMVALRLELAKEKMINAKQLQETAQSMRQQWVNQVFGKRAIPAGTQANIDVDAGTIVTQPSVQETTPVQPPPAPEPAPQESPAP